MPSLMDRGLPKVYFVGGAGLIKIGLTTDVDHRFRNLRSSSPVDLEFLGYVFGDRQDEREWHQRFADLRRHFEWGQETPELIAAIEEVVDPLWHRRRAA